MFYEGGFFMAGMHFLWWVFCIALIGVVVFYGWGRPRERPHEALRQRLASGEGRSSQCEERKALLDHDAACRA